MTVYTMIWCIFYRLHLHTFLRLTSEKEGTTKVGGAAELCAPMAVVVVLLQRRREC
jgi:hypothetical protein